MYERPRVVIIGAGFGGLWAIRTMVRSPVNLLLIDCNNYHTFLPLLYQMSTAELEPEGIAFPVRGILRKLPNVRFVMAQVNRVNLVQRLVETDSLTIPYDFLIIATGSVSHFFDIPGAEDHAFPLKSLEQGIAIRNHILGCFEQAVKEPDKQRRHEILTFTIIGGGATGVEFTGALAELIRGPLAKDYPMLDFRKVRIVLLEAKDCLLSGLPSNICTYAIKQLRKMGVEIRLQAGVARITQDVVHLKDGTSIPTRTVIWTAGVRGHPQAQIWGLPTNLSGRVTVLPTLQVPEHPEVYVIGDLAYFEQDKHPLPMIAPVAIQQGIAAANNVLLQIAGQTVKPFRYRDRGMMVTIGRNSAVAQIRHWAFKGFSAWLLWLSVHLFNLIGFRNRLLVLINWAWDYLFYERAIRLIIPSETAPHHKE